MFSVFLTCAEQGQKRDKTLLKWEQRFNSFSPKQVKRMTKWWANINKFLLALTKGQIGKNLNNISFQKGIFSSNKGCTSVCYSFSTIGTIISFVLFLNKRIVKYLKPKTEVVWFFSYTLLINCKYHFYSSYFAYNV